VIDHRAYSRYSKPLERQMSEIVVGRLSLRSALENAEGSGQEREMASAVRSLIADLSLKTGWKALSEDVSGEGHLAMYRDLDSDLERTRAFVERFPNPGTQAGKEIRGKADRLLSDLVKMRELVASTPPEVLAQIKDNLQMADVPSSPIGAMSSLVFVAVLAARWFGLWKVSWFAAVPLAVLAGGVAAAVLLGFKDPHR
jgi:hypothetical protein